MKKLTPYISSLMLLITGTQLAAQNYCSPCPEPCAAPSQPCVVPCVPCAPQAGAWCGSAYYDPVLIAGIGAAIAVGVLLTTTHRHHAHSHAH